MKTLSNIFRSDVGSLLGTLVLAAIVVIAIFAPAIAPGDPFALRGDPFIPPSADFWLGTDNIGRDVFAMMVHGTRVSVLFAFGAAGFSLVVGVILGGLAGYYGEFVDDLISRVGDALLIIPRLFLIIMMVALFGSRLWLVVLIVGGTLWPANARVMRAQVLVQKGRGFVQAARVAGAGDGAIIFGQIMPNCIGPVLANSILQIAYAILTEASLAFLGLADPNVPSWGQIIYSGQNYLSTAPWLMLFPGIALAVLLLSVHLLGSGLIEHLNPRLRRVASIPSKTGIRHVRGV